MSAAEFGKRLARDIKGTEYKQQLAQQMQAAEWTRFRALYPEQVWAQMTGVQQAQAWASWRQGQHVARAAKKSIRTIVWVLVWIFVLVPLIAWVLIRAL